jgi:hypothetical protein
MNLRSAVLRVLLKFGFTANRVTTKSALLVFLGKIKPLNTQFELIRIGGPGDGGYLVPDDLDGIRTCFSPGVSDTANFELQLAQTGIYCYLADYSVEKSPIEHPNFDFKKKFIGPLKDEIFITLEDWIMEKGTQDADSILQMDIEGAEYSAILTTPQSVLRKFRIIIVEFHGMNDLLDPKVFPYISTSFEKLLQDFAVIHIHPNNASDPVEFQGINLWPTMEFTFLRKDRIVTSNNRSDFPHKLDANNAPNKPTSILSKEWFVPQV